VNAASTEIDSSRALQAYMEGLQIVTVESVPGGFGIGYHISNGNFRHHHCEAHKQS